MTYIKSKKKGFWLVCNFPGCKEQGFFFDNPTPYYRGWRMNAEKKEHYCPECVKKTKALKFKGGQKE